MEEIRLEANGNIGPIDSSRIPRFAGPATFARLPRLDEVAPAPTSRSSACPSTPGCPTVPAPGSVPTHVREASRLLRPYNPALDVSPVRAGPGRGRRRHRGEPVQHQRGDRDHPARRAGAHRRRRAAGDPRRRPHHRAAAAARGRRTRRTDPVALLHFDAHLDTWDTYFGAEYTHGTPFRRAVEEGILDTEAISHVGTRGPLYGQEGPGGRQALRLRHRDQRRRLSPGGGDEIVAKLRDRIGNRPLYVSVDIDVLDPAHAPGTGTPEAGGITSRELLEILRGLRGMNLVGADVVEVSPAYDHAEITGVAASHVAYDLVALMADLRSSQAGAGFGAGASLTGQRKDA